MKASKIENQFAKNQC